MKPQYDTSHYLDHFSASSPVPSGGIGETVHLTHSCPRFQHLLSDRQQMFKGGTRGAPIMPRDVSLSDSKCWNGGQKWVNGESGVWCHILP